MIKKKILNQTNFSVIYDIKAAKVWNVCVDELNERFSLPTLLKVMNIHSFMHGSIEYAVKNIGMLWLPVSWKFVKFVMHNCNTIMFHSKAEQYGNLLPAVLQQWGQIMKKYSEPNQC